MISLLARLLIVMWTITLEVTHVAENSKSLNEAKVLGGRISYFTFNCFIPITGNPRYKYIRSRNNFRSR